VRGFLIALWKQADQLPPVELAGMLVPYFQPRVDGLLPVLAEESEELVEVNPFAPLVIMNVAKRVVQISRGRPFARFAVVVRPCEGRTLAAIEKRQSFGLSRWLIIGVDCFASFPYEDFSWRLEKAGSIDNLTRETLKFARQGEIAPYRFRQACQMCHSAGWQGADLTIGLLGLPIQDYILITAKDTETARKYHLNQVTDGLAPPGSLTLRQQVLLAKDQRHLSIQQRMLDGLEDGHPDQAAALIAMLQRCTPCRSCLHACPLYNSELENLQAGSEVQINAINCWLSNCVACGICEEACLQRIPLTAILLRIGQMALVN
jgi:NAD-dependent dihydropyrimidine dehydrogenase PreA subunit